MCKSLPVNRRTMLRVVRDKEVTGVDLHRCAVNIVALIEAHPCQTAKVEDILVKLVQQGVVVLRDATLRRADVGERTELLMEQGRIRRRVRARTAARRAGGVRGLTPLAFEDPDRDPNEPTSEERDYGEWVASTLPVGVEGFPTAQAAQQAIDRIRTRKLVGLALDRLADDRADKGLLPA